MIVECPSCGSDRIRLEDVSEIVFKGICVVSFICDDCGHRGRLKVQSGEGNKLEIVLTESRQGNGSYLNALQIRGI
ncbi:MAG: hypothetical protein M1290_07290 [Candidatus Thermoplasmatota archaeon]|nr:hypothetical protein [Candidatus Thermoplasmatota archaeon]MCL5790247.1 hypothetical protein [Candidatus Thermoplasmatota archaeon]